jgi:hypothetical protein
MNDQRNGTADHLGGAARGIGAGLLAILLGLFRQCDDVARIGLQHADDVGRGALSQADDIGRNALGGSDDLLRNADDLRPEPHLHEIGWEHPHAESAVPATDPVPDEELRLVQPLLRESVQRASEALITPEHDTED